MDDTRILMWHPPQPIAFSLIEAHRHAELGAKRRRKVMSGLKKRKDGEWSPASSSAAVDCVRDLTTAVLFAFTAIESLANHAIDMLPEDHGITRKGAALDAAGLMWLPLEEKLKLVIPTIGGGRPIAGDARIWKRYKALKFLRDELVHVKERGYSSDPDEPSAYDRLMLGEADHCAADAFVVVNGAWPGFLPDFVVDALGDDAEGAATKPG